MFPNLFFIAVWLLTIYILKEMKVFLWPDLQSALFVWVDSCFISLLFIIFDLSAVFHRNFSYFQGSIS